MRAQQVKTKDTPAGNRNNIWLVGTSSFTLTIFGVSHFFTNLVCHTLCRNHKSGHVLSQPEACHSIRVWSRHLCSLLHLCLPSNYQNAHSCYSVAKMTECHILETKRAIRDPLHNALFVQYIYLATEQAQTYRKSCSLMYLVTYICPSAFDCEENAFFWIFVKSNSKSGRFSSFLMPNNFGTGQKKAYFLGALEN